MNVLLLTHGFPPHQTAGTESYAADLGVELARRGHVVRVFSAHKDISRPNYKLVRREWRGLQVAEITNNLFHRDFRETYANPAVEKAFEALLAEFRPDVVHVQHLMYLSTGCVTAARAHAARVVFTLHDFWLQCPRLGQRVHADGGLCDTVDFQRCGTCLTRFKFTNTGLERTLGGVLAGIRTGTGVDLAPLARGAARHLRKPPRENDPLVDEAGALALALAAEERTRHMRSDVVPAVDLFLSPSRFLRERFLREWQVPPERIEHLPFGVDARPAREPRDPASPLRVSFLGSLVPLKGAHVLVAAWARIDPALRTRGRLTLYGPARHHPAYQDELARAAAACGAELGGLLERSRVPETLARTDLLVVPSLWYENSPLVILEALAARTPLLVSRLGGMEELVQEGVTGRRFVAGDVEDLAAQLAAALAGTFGLERMYAGVAPPPTFAEHVETVVARYAAAPSCGSG